MRDKGPNVRIFMRTETCRDRADEVHRPNTGGCDSVEDFEPSASFNGAKVDKARMRQVFCVEGRDVRIGVDIYCIWCNRDACRVRSALDQQLSCRSAYGYKMGDQSLAVCFGHIIHETLFDQITLGIVDFEYMRNSNRGEHVAYFRERSEHAKRGFKLATAAQKERPKTVSGMEPLGGSDIEIGVDAKVGEPVAKVDTFGWR